MLSPHPNYCHWNPQYCNKAGLPEPTEPGFLGGTCAVAEYFNNGRLRQPCNKGYSTYKPASLDNKSSQIFTSGIPVSGRIWLAGYWNPEQNKQEGLLYKSFGFFFETRWVFLNVSPLNIFYYCTIFVLSVPDIWDVCSPAAGQCTRTWRPS